MGSAFPFPPRRALAAVLVPTAWVDDALIAERKAGLQMFLTDILHDLSLRTRPEVLRFLAPDAANTTYAPAMMSTGAPASYARDGVAGRYISASYYPSWSADALPAHTIDFSKFDVLFFGA